VRPEWRWTNGKFLPLLFFAVVLEHQPIRAHSACEPSTTVDMVTNFHYVMGIHCYRDFFFPLPFHLGLQGERRDRGTRMREP